MGYRKVELTLGTDSQRPVYGRTDLLLLSRALEEMARGEFDDDFSNVEEPLRMLLDRFEIMSGDIVKLLYQEHLRSSDVMEDELTRDTLNLHVESYRSMYNDSKRFASWVQILPLSFVTSLASHDRRLAAERAAIENMKYRMEDGSLIYLDILLPALVNRASFVREQAYMSFHAIAGLIQDENFPAFATKEMLDCGRLLIVPTADALNRMAEFEKFRHGVFGLARSLPRSKELPEHMRGVRVTMDNLVRMADGSLSIDQILNQYVSDNSGDQFDEELSLEEIRELLRNCGPNDDELLATPEELEQMSLWGSGRRTFRSQDYDDMGLDGESGYIQAEDEPEF